MKIQKLHFGQLGLSSVRFQDYIASGGRVRGIAMLSVTSPSFSTGSLCGFNNLITWHEAVINPGNPTGTVLTRDVIEAVVRRALPGQNGLVLGLVFHLLPRLSTCFVLCQAL